MRRALIEGALEDVDAVLAVDATLEELEGGWAHEALRLRRSLLALAACPAAPFTLIWIIN
mgnify:CR=1 FL=1